MKRKIWRYAPLIIWLIFIFYLSSSQGSMSQTSRFIRPILEFLFPRSSEEFYTLVHGYIRKTAHFCVYFTLACFAARAFVTSGKKKLKDFWFLTAFLLVLATASLDETNQSFNSLRTGTPYDVMLDCFGGLTAIILIASARKIFQSEKNR